MGRWAQQTRRGGGPTIAQLKTRVLTVVLVDDEHADWTFSAAVNLLGNPTRLQIDTGGGYIAPSDAVALSSSVLRVEYSGEVLAAGMPTRMLTAPTPQLTTSNPLGFEFPYSGSVTI